jgi:putative ABC transport system permease protein
MRSRLLLRDVLRVGAVGLRTRRVRAALSAVGIAIGIASMVAVLGISQSSKADLLAQLDSLGTNLLTAGPGQSFFGDDSKLPTTAVVAVSGMPTIQRAASVAAISASVRRTDRIPAEETGGISVKAADRGLLTTLQGSLRSGRFLDAASERFPAVVLGSLAAQRLGITDATAGLQLFVGGHWLTVIGILDPLPLAPELDRAALIGYPAAAELYGIDRHAERLYVRADPDRVADARELLAPTAYPEKPEEVLVSRPSDALAARAAAKGTFTALLLGLGAVALLVGGVGIANVMVISVLERRSEIGLRRALGATRRHISTQFLTEALLLAALGGTVGIVLGAVVTAGYATSQGWIVTVPALAVAGGAGAALAIGAVAGLYPATRAARLSPTEALRGS